MSELRGYRLRNTSSDVVRLSTGEVIAGDSVGVELHSLTGLARTWREVTALGLTVAHAEPPFEDATDAIISELREVGLLQPGQRLVLPRPGRPARKKTNGSARGGSRMEYLAGRLHGVEDVRLSTGDLEHVTLAAFLSRHPFPEVGPTCGVLDWPMPENLDVGAFSGIVRLCASTMGGRNQRVLLVGDMDSVETVAACTLREFLGCAAETAIGLIRACRRTGLTKSELLETVYRYRPS